MEKPTTKSQDLKYTRKDIFGLLSEFKSMQGEKRMNTSNKRLHTESKEKLTMAKSEKSKARKTIYVKYNTLASSYSHGVEFF